MLADPVPLSVPKRKKRRGKRGITASLFSIGKKRKEKGKATSGSTSKSYVLKPAVPRKKEKGERGEKQRERVRSVMFS